MEQKTQAKLIRWLKSQGAYVVKTRPGLGTPVGCPDVIALYGPRWAAIEVKADAASKFQPGQKATLTRLEYQNAFVYVVHSENYAEMQKKIAKQFFQNG